jgi:hypothetical protein
MFLYPKRLSVKAKAIYLCNDFIEAAVSRFGSSWTSHVLILIISEEAIGKSEGHLFVSMTLKRLSGFGSSWNKVMPECLLPGETSNA